MANEINKQSPPQRIILWLMGPTSSGKTSIAKAFTASLQKRGDVPIIHYDGDEIRSFFGDGHGFAASDRLRVVKTLVHLANKGNAAGLHVIVSALTANEDARAFVAENLLNGRIVYVECSIEVCASRDPKGLYEKAAKGEIDTLIGVNSQYRAPDNPEMVINTETNQFEVALEKLEEYFFNETSK